MRQLLRFRHALLIATPTLGVALAMMSCKPGTSGLFDAGGSGGSASTKTAADTTGAFSTTDGQPGNTANSTAAQFMTGSTGAGPSSCDAGPDEDKDGDGFTINQGDCNDCDPNVNPAAVEVIVTDPDPMTGMVPAPADENCDGQIDNVDPPCDSGLQMDSANGLDAAKAIELCHKAAGPKDYGVVTAKYVRANGAAAGASQQYGILPKFGSVIKPRKGGTLLALSSGRARDASQSGNCGSLSCDGYGAGTPPSSAFPQDAPGCSEGTNINDDVGLEVQLRAPSNATGYGFDFRFFSFEYPEWVCSEFNDEFVAYVQPPPTGALAGNISFDAMHAPVSVNVAFFTVCDPGSGSSPCTDGPGDMAGTGFNTWDDAGGTAWLQTVAPVKGGSDFKIRFTIWDTGDQAWDSTALIDNFHWIASGGTTVVIGTNPVPQ